RLRGAKNAAHQKALKEWTGNRRDPAMFAEEILPGLREVSIARLAEATRLSGHYCSLIRLGKRVPHERHWDSLRTLGEGCADEMGGSQSHPEQASKISR